MIKRCVSCRVEVQPGHFVEFDCPKCGKVKMYRCSACREVSNPYKCPECGFEGP